MPPVSVALAVVTVGVEWWLVVVIQLFVAVVGVARAEVAHVLVVVVVVSVLEVAHGIRHTHTTSMSLTTATVFTNSIVT